MLAATAGILDFSFIQTVQPNSGLSSTFPVFAAVIIGGASLSGGKGTVIGTIGGALLLAEMQTGPRAPLAPARTRSSSSSASSPSAPWRSTCSLTSVRARTGGMSGPASDASGRRDPRAAQALRRHPSPSTGSTSTRDPGEVLGIAGPNGAGKSTLVRILAGEERADDGHLTVDGAPWSPPRQRRRVAVVHQEPQLFPNLTVAENMLVGREGTRFAPPAARRRPSGP